MKGTNNKYPLSNIILLIFAIPTIFTLSFLFSYFAIIPPSVPEIATMNTVVANTKPPKTATTVITYAVPQVLPKEAEQGSCMGSSAAEPFRQDAFRCTVQNSIYDPCFSLQGGKQVICDANPLLENDTILINLTSALPKTSLAPGTGKNWAWFVELEDGTYCAPFTGTRPFVSDQVAYYGCNSLVKEEQVVIFGDLIPGESWSAKKAVLVRSGADWIIKSSKEVIIKTLWK